MAIKMYLEGLGFQAIGGLLNISYGTTINGIDNLENNINSNPIQMKSLNL